MNVRRYLFSPLVIWPLAVAIGYLGGALQRHIWPF